MIYSIIYILCKSKILCEIPSVQCTRMIRREIEKEVKFRNLVDIFNKNSGTA